MEKIDPSKTIDYENDAGEYINALVVLRNLRIESEATREKIYSLMHDLLDIAQDKLKKERKTMTTKILFNQK